MARRRFRLGGGAARLLMLLAAVFLAFGPALDSAAHAATVEKAKGGASIAIQVLSAFDVIEDVLDHLPGELTAVAHLNLQLLHAVPDGVAFTPVVADAPNAWPVHIDARLSSVAPEGQDDPPRT